MSRSRRDARQGLEDVAEVVAEAVRNRSNSEYAERRRQEKEARRRRQEEEQRRQLLATGAGLLAGGLAASLGLITAGAVGVGLLVGGVVVYGMKALEGQEKAPRLPAAAPRPALADPQVPSSDPRASLIRTVVTSAMGHMRAIDHTAQSIADVEIAAILTRIAAIGARICERVAEEPAAFDAAQRLLTHHAEKAAHLGSMAQAHAASGDTARLTAARRVLGRMEALFEQTENELAAGDRREMDLELRLIDQALDEDLRREGP